MFYAYKRAHELLGPGRRTWTYAILHDSTQPSPAPSVPRAIGHRDKTSEATAIMALPEGTRAGAM
jgi:hypothetical protein